MSKLPMCLALGICIAGMGTAVNSNAHTANSQNYIDVGHWIVTTSEELCAKYKLIGYICKIVKPSDPNYETPTVITGIRGTALLLDIAPDSTTTITALEGDQDIFIRDTGESLVLRAGEIITIPPTTNLHWPIEYNPSLTNIAPSCRVSGAGITPEGKTFVNLVVQDDDNGLNAIGVQDIVNAEVVVEGQQLQRGDAISLNQLIFTPVTITVTKIDDTKEVRVDLGVDDDIGATACDVVTRNLNDLLTLEKSPPDTTYNPNDPRARAGTFTILPTFINATAEGRPTGIVAIYFKVAELTGFNKVLNVDEGLGQEGSTIVVQPDVLGTDGVLQPGEAFRFSFDIGIDKSGSFSFFVDTFGIAVGPFAESE